MAKLNWTQINGTPDFIDSTRTWIAVYKRTVKGQAEFWTFPCALDASKRTSRRAATVGGKPEFTGQMRV